MHIKAFMTGLGTLFLSAMISNSAVVSVGSGSYTTTFPGVDEAGRNGYPGGLPQLSGNAVGRPVPTNDWWSKLLNTNHADNLFNYPMAMGTGPSGLDIGLVVPTPGGNGSSEPRDPFDTVVVGVSGLNATKATVDDYSDWTVSMAWNSGAHAFRATAGIGMPFVYFSKAVGDTASVTVSQGSVTVMNEVLLITGSEDGADLPSMRRSARSGRTAAVRTPRICLVKTIGRWPFFRRATPRLWRRIGSSMPMWSRPTPQ